MQQPMPVVALMALVLGWSTPGCVRRYRPPQADEPHAVVKLRRVYEVQAGESLREDFRVDDDRAYHVTVPAKQGAAPRNDAVLLHPEPGTFQLDSTFFHHELRPVQESYVQQVPYMATESYSCGTFQSPRTCTRSVTRYRSETKYRTVTRNVEVPDGRCKRAIRFAPQAGRTYLLQYTYQGDDACHLACYEQAPTGAGQFSQKPCPAAPAD